MGTCTASLGSGLRTEGDVNGYANGNLVLIPFTIRMSASYATGGDTIVLPDDVAGLQFVGVILLDSKSGANRYNLSGTQTAPLIQAFSAFDTQVANTTDLSAVTLRAIAVCQR